MQLEKAGRWLGGAAREEGVSAKGREDPSEMGNRRSRFLLPQTYTSFPTHPSVAGLEQLCNSFCPHGGKQGSECVINTVCVRREASPPGGKRRVGGWAGHRAGLAERSQKIWVGFGAEGSVLPLEHSVKGGQAA